MSRDHISVNDVQCMCGRKFIRTDPAVFSAPGFEGVECDDQCRERFETDGIAPNGAPRGRKKVNP